MFDNYAAYEYLLASSQLFLAMLGMGALLAPSDFLSEIKKPKSLLVGITLQWCFLPLIAFALSFVLPVPVGIVIGLMLVAVVPSGVTGNILTYIGRGNIALSISLTAITTVAALLTTPLLMHLMLSAYLPADFEMPIKKIAQDIVIALVIPLGLGMLLKAKVKTETSEQFARWIIRLSLALIVVMGFGAGNSGRLDPQAYGVMGIAALVIFCFSIQVTAWILGWIAKLPAADMLAIVIKSNYRNISLAVAIKAIVFPAQSGQLDPVGDAVFFTILLYGGVSLVMSLVPVAISRLKIRKI